jgi:hypothetical protein
MPGKRINFIQIGIYMKYRKEGNTQEVAAAKSGFSERSARNLKNRDYKEAKANRTWTTRKDPFAKVWDSELVPLLEKNPTLQARTLLEDLQLKYDGKYPDSLLRTLQRRVQKWKALYGDSKKVIFRQNHPPGWQGLSDFTVMNELEVTIKKAPLEHLLYHYRLACSGWKHVEVILGGESFTALAESFQNALWHCGGVPETHRTDSLSAAYKNLPEKSKECFQKQYKEFCDHYGIEPTRNNKGKSHENGSIESPHGHFKTRVDQALMLRGHRDFDSINDYRLFIKEIANRDNRRVQELYKEELACLKPLPVRRTTDYTIERAKVSNTSTINIKGIIYSVPSRLIGQSIKVHLFDNRLVCFVGMTHLFDLVRKRKGKKHKREIDYRHLIDEISRKPGAFKNYIFREDFFPTEAFRLTCERLESAYSSRQASKEYLGILRVAAKGDRESIVDRFLSMELKKGRLISSESVEALFKKPSKALPKISVEVGDLGSYSTFLSGGVS